MFLQLCFEVSCISVMIIFMRKPSLAQTTAQLSHRASFIVAFVLSHLWLLKLIYAQENSFEIFPRPPELEPAISFWKKVYTEVDTDHGYLHDSENLSIIYASLNRNSREIETVRQRIKNDLGVLATGQRSNLSKSQEAILTLWPEDVSNQRLQEAISNVRFQVGQSNAFLEGLERSGAYRDYINDILSDKNMPPQLALLPHVESSFNPNAYSHANAAGMWQFTRPTGQRFMRIDDVIDERMDPYISADAAMDLLKYNHQVLGSWPLALTAYNQGVGSMSRAVRETGTASIEEIIENYKGPRFGFVGRNFYPQFLAVNDIEDDIDQYFETVQYAIPTNFTEVRLNSYIEARGIGESLNIPLSELRDDNPSLRNVIWQGLKRIPRGFRIKLRTDQLPEGIDIIAKIDSSYKHSMQLPDAYYEIQRGETLQTIANKFETTPRQLASLNEIRNPDDIQAGQRISIPMKEDNSNNQPQTPILQDDLLNPDPANNSEISKDSLDEPEQNFEVVASPLQEIDEDMLLATGTLSEPQDAQSSPSADLIESDIREVSQNLFNPASILDSDPSDYSVAVDSTIVLQASESIGQLANWLEIPTWDIRRLNNISYGDRVVIGSRVQINFARVSRSEFENRRREFHSTLQQDFFERFTIRGSEEYEIKRTDNINRLALNRYSAPLWLVRQYNPGINFSSVYVGQRVVFPLLESIGNSNIN